MLPLPDSTRLPAEGLGEHSDAMQVAVRANVDRGDRGLGLELWLIVQPVADHLVQPVELVAADAICRAPR